MRVSVNRHLRAVATALALLGMLLLSTGVALIVAAPANASSAKPKGGDDCGGDDLHKRTVKSDDDGCGGGCGDGGDDDKRLVKAGEGDDCGGCDKPQVFRSGVRADDDEECGDPCDIIIIGKRSTQIGDDDCIAPDPEVTFTDPSCENENTASWEGTGEHSTFELIDGTVGPGEEITVEAHTVFPYEYDNEETSMEFNHTFGPAVTQEECTPPTIVVPTDPSFTEPTCDTDGSVVVPNEPVGGKKAPGPVLETTDVGGVHYVVTGSLKAGETAYVDATALPGYVIAEDAETHWEHTFAVPEDCPVVSPPVVTPPVVDPVVAPTVVHAGLIGTAAAAADPRTDQGRLLAALGVALLVLAGGLGLRPSSASRR